MGRRIFLVLSVAVFVAVLLVTTAPAMAQDYGPTPKTGGPAVESVLLPAAAMLVGSGVLAYAILRRSR